MNHADREKTCLPLLERTPGFASVPADALAYLAAGCHQRTATRGQLLCERGQQLGGFHVLLRGRVKLSLLSAEGAERVLDIVLPGRTFGESAAFLGRPCALHAEALMDSRLLYVDLNRVRNAIPRWPEIANLMLVMVAERAQRLIADLEACCLHSAAQRVVAMLLRDAQSDADEPDRATLELPAAKTVVASSLNLSAETFSRELHGLVRRGLIEVERRAVRIPSLEQLRRRGGLEAADLEPSAPLDAC
ncbi:Crp/Fnr family transcriptional regulator [Halochromatium sp.]